MSQTQRSDSKNKKGGGMFRRSDKLKEDDWKQIFELLMQEYLIQIPDDFQDEELFFT